MPFEGGGGRGVRRKLSKVPNYPEASWRWPEEGFRKCSSNGGKVVVGDCTFLFRMGFQLLEDTAERDGGVGGKVAPHSPILLNEISGRNFEISYHESGCVKRISLELQCSGATLSQRQKSRQLCFSIKLILSLIEEACGRLVAYTSLFPFFWAKS